MIAEYHLFSAKINKYHESKFEPSKDMAGGDTLAYSFHNLSCYIA